jgi:F0F1-type ATP synthase alpha subunit
LKQSQYSPLPISEQIVLVFLGVNGFFDNIVYGSQTTSGLLKSFSQLEFNFLNYLKTAQEGLDLVALIKLQKEVKQETALQIGVVFNNFCKSFFLLV